MKSFITKEYTIWCDTCGVWSQFNQFVGAVDQKSAIQIAKSHGWIIDSKVNTCLCKSCHDSEEDC